MKNYKLPHGNLIALYDLAKVDVKKNKKFYYKDYVLAINDEKHNSLFLNKFKKRFKSSSSLWNEASVKISRIKDLMLKLNNKYKFLNSSEVSFLNSKLLKITLSFHELVRLDKISRGIPIMLPEYNPYVSSYYGMRKHPIKKKNKFHSGIDLVARKSTPVYAAADGTVMHVDYMKSYGNTLVVKHSHKFKTRYAHLKTLNVKKGDRVLKGQKVGIQGKTGHATGEHLHFEIWLNDKHVDPFDFLAHSEMTK